jgi:hypothetical protein
LSRRSRFFKLLLVLTGFFIVAASLSSHNESSPNPGGDKNIEQMLDRLAQQERYFDLTQDHIDFLRTVTVQYDPDMENGATVLDFHAARTLPERIAARLWDHFILSKARKSELEASFEIFLAFAELGPGRYAIAPDDVTDDRPDTPEALRVTAPPKFQFTEQHLKLLNHANGRWDDFYDSLIIDPKRPYGDMTYFELDMADILGMPIQRDGKDEPKIAPAQQAIFDGLFGDLPVSLQTFLKYASISPGRFYRKPAGWGAWKRVSVEPGAAGGTN